MDGPSILVALTAHLALLASISFGGFPTVLPAVRDFVVGNHGWMTDQDFSNFFALAQAVPVFPPMMRSQASRSSLIPCRPGPAAHAGANPSGASLVRCREAERLSLWCRARKPDAGGIGGARRP